LVKNQQKSRFLSLVFSTNGLECIEYGPASWQSGLFKQPKLVTDLVCIQPCRSPRCPFFILKCVSYKQHDGSLGKLQFFQLF